MISERALRRSMQDDGYTPDEIEDVCADRADYLIQLEKDRRAEEALFIVRSVPRQCDTHNRAPYSATADRLTMDKEKRLERFSKSLIYKGILVGDTWIEHVTPAV